DSSLKSLEGSVQVTDAQGHAVTESQLTWLDQTLAARPAGERAIVVSETPTYSYGPGAASDTLSDASGFESILMRNKVDLVVTGRLGWNGRYWALAPGLHT